MKKRKRLKRMLCLILASAMFLTIGWEAFASFADDVSEATVEESADSGRSGYNIELDIAEHGYLYFTGTDGIQMEMQYSEGDTVTVTAVPAEGYTLSTISLLDKDGVFIQQDEDAEITYDEETREVGISFPMPAEDAVLSVTFNLIPEEYTEEFLEEFEAETKELVEDLSEESGGESSEAGDSEADGVSLGETKSLSLATYSVSGLASGTTTFTKGTNHTYNAYSTYEGRAIWNGNSCVTFCVEPSDKTPKSGSYTVTEWDSDLARAVCYYGYGASGYNDADYGMLPTMIGAGSPNEAFAYVYTHLALSWVYDGCSASSDAFKGVYSGTVSAVQGWVNRLNNAGVTAPAGLHVYLFNTGSTSYQCECFWYLEPSGYAKVKKVSGNSSITSGNSNYSLAGAKYQIFATEAEARAAATGSSANNTNSLATLTTDSGGNTGTVTFDPGTYYVREIVASKGYNLDTNVYPVTVTSGNTSTVTSTEVPYTGSLTVYKYSDDNSATDGNSEYSLSENTTFGVYTDSACSGTAVATLKLNRYDSVNKRAYGTATGLAYGTYYVKEITAPKGYYSNAEIKQVTIGSTTASASFSLSFWDEPIRITVEITKKADMEDIAASNAGGEEAGDDVKQFILENYTEGYSLEGAVYGIYSDSECTTMVDQVTTDADGKGTGYVELMMGTYYVKEIVAPEGFLLSDEVYTVIADNTVVSESDTTVEAEVGDKPESGKVVVYKRSSAPAITDAYPEYYSLDGAEYTVYYSEDMSDTGIAGVITIKDGKGELDGVLYGDVWIKETKAPQVEIDGVMTSMYSLDETVYHCTVSSETAEVTIASTDTPVDRTIYIYKGPLAMLENGTNFTKHIPDSVTSVVFTNSKTIPEEATDGNCLTDVSFVQDGSIMAWLEGTTWYVQSVSGGTIYFNYDSSYMFSEATGYSGHSLQTVDFGSGVINTSYVTTMASLFYNCRSLVSVGGLTEFDTANVTSMQNMFAFCPELTSLDLSGFHTGKVTSFHAMFNVDHSLESITGIENFDTSSATTIGYMFNECYKITSLDLHTWNVSNTTKMNVTFGNMNIITTINLTGWDTSNVTNMNAMFYQCYVLQTIQGLEMFDTSKVTEITGMFQQCYVLDASMTLSCTDCLYNTQTSSSTTGMHVFYGTSRDSGRFTLYYIQEAKTLSMKIAADPFCSSKVTFTVMTAAADTSAFSLAASVAGDIRSGIRSVFFGFDGSFLAKAAGKMGIVTDALAEEAERSLTNAVYCAYTDSGCTSFYGSFTYTETITDTNGEQVAIYVLYNVPYGQELWVKEIKASTGYLIDEDTYYYGANAADKTYCNSTEIPEETYPPETDYKASIMMYKTSSDNNVTYNNSNYSYEGAEYTLYADKGCTTELTDGSGQRYTMTTDADGYAELAIELGEEETLTCYIVETATPAGYSQDPNFTAENPYEIVLSAYNTTEIVFSDEEPPHTGGIYVYKRSSDDTLTPDTNSSYSYEGAVFGIYKDESCSDASLYTLLTTDESGYAETDGVPLGTYWIRELVAPAGYEVNSEVYSVTVAEDGTTENGGSREGLTVTDAPKTGALEILKYSDNTSVTNGNGNYSLEGAVFDIYMSDGSTVYTTLTTDADGHASVSGLPLGTYYVEETAASKGFKVNSGSYEAVLSSANATGGSVYTVPVAETPQTVTLSVVKSSADPDATDGNGNYTLEGAVFGIYSDDACSSLLSTMTTDADGKASSAELAIGTYYIQEMQAPAGFTVNSTVYKADCTDGSVTYTDLATGESGSSLLSGSSLSVTDDIETAQLRVYKESDDRDLTAPLDTYTLAGAVYGVYASKSDASDDVISADGTGTLGLGYLTTDESGVTEYLDGLVYGIYYVKETLAPVGFEMDTEIYTVELTQETVDAEKNVELAVTDTASYGPAIRIIKESAQDNAPGPLDGTQFVIQYYDGSYTTQDEIQAASPATKFWVIEVQEVNGEYVAELSDDYLVDGSDSLYYDEDGDVILPVGTYTIYESLAPDLYSADGSWLDSDGNELAVIGSDSAILFQVKQDDTGKAYIEATAAEDGNEFTVTPEAENGVVTFTKEDMALGSITVIKQDTDGNVLSGVTYELAKYNELTDDYEKVMSATTDDSGTVLFDELEYGTYRITETATVDGFSLLADAIEVTIPYVISVKEAEKLGADMDSAVFSSNGETCYFVDLTYTIADSEIFGLPATGADQTLPVIAFAGLGILALGLIMLFRRRKV